MILSMIAKMRWAIALLATAALAAAQDEPGYDELVAAYNKAQKEFYDAWRKTRAEDPGATYPAEDHPRNEYRPKFEALARRVAGTDEAVGAWVMVLRCGGDRDAVRDVLLEEYAESPKLAAALYGFAYDDNGFLEAAAEKSPHREVKAVAYYLTGARLLREGDAGRADPYFVMCRWKYADVPMYGSTVGKKAASALFEARHLAVGRPVPDIEGEDVDGVEFKLSDYRGKVIFLDFWGDW